MYQASRLPLWERVFHIVGDSTIFWLWHHLLIVALGLLTLLGLVIYLVVSGIRQKTSLKLSGQSSFSVPAWAWSTLP
ncbi:hypothetical protein [Lactobacillus delbrueckii]|uniref:hypothetical protein n=1 Tax=Lactobacillus delbrueckii TaxID=1584 RepID=UPI001E62C2AB|nr:hypothetical protein [Lactobacillus delbrueckii]MCD5450870.1 hypothetical protein [Lactobacillus delbrueckii subsp. lactis]